MQILGLVGRILVMMLLVAACVQRLPAVEAVDDDSRPVAVPDPQHQGESLALIAYLSEHHLALPAAGDLIALRRAYLASLASRKGADAAQDADVEALRAELATRFRIAAPPSASREELAHLIAAGTRLLAQHPVQSIDMVYPPPDGPPLVDEPVTDADLQALGATAPPPVPRMVVDEMTYRRTITEQLQPLTMMEFRSAAPANGLWMTHIVPQSTADGNGVQSHDIMLSLAGTRLISTNDFLHTRGDRSTVQRLVCWNPFRGLYAFDAGTGPIGIDLVRTPLVAGDYLGDGESQPAWDEDILNAVQSTFAQHYDAAETALARALAKGCRGRVIDTLMCAISFHQGRLPEAIAAGLAALPRTPRQHVGVIADTIYQAALANNELKLALLLEQRFPHAIRTRTQGWSLAAAIQRGALGADGRLRTAESQAEHHLRTDLLPQMSPLSPAAEDTFASFVDRKPVSYRAELDCHQDLTYAPASQTFDLSCTIDLDEARGESHYGPCLSINLVHDAQSGPWVDATFYSNGLCTIRDQRYSRDCFEFLRDPRLQPIHARMVVFAGQFSVFLEGQRFYAGPLGGYDMPPSYVQFKAVGCHGTLSGISISAIDAGESPPPPERR